MNDFYWWYLTRVAPWIIVGAFVATIGFWNVVWWFQGRPTMVGVWFQ